MNPSNWLDNGYDTIALNGVPLLTQRTIANIVTGAGVTATVADNPATEQTDITLSSGAGAPVASTGISSDTALVSPVANAAYVVKSTGSGITVTIEGTPAVGTRLTFFDGSKNWGTYNFTFQPQSGALVQDPADIKGANGSTAVLSLSGGSVTWEYVNVEGITAWLCV